jgi:hypothetical protein
VYTLIRGHYTNWYPYPFFNPNLSSYMQVLLTSAVIAVFVIIAALILRLYSLKRNHN